MYIIEIRKLVDMSSHVHNVDMHERTVARQTNTNIMQDGQHQHSWNVHLCCHPVCLLLLLVFDHTCLQGL